MDVQVILLEERSFIREHRLHKAHRDLNGFLHDVAELSGYGEFAVALSKQSLNEEDFSTCRGPGKSCHDAGLLLSQHAVMPYGLCVEHLAQVFFFDNYGIRLGHCSRIRAGFRRSGLISNSLRSTSLLSSLLQSLHCRRSNSLRHLHSRRPAQCIQALAQSAHAGFHRVVVDDAADDVIRDDDLFLCDAHLFHGFGQQVPAGDLELVRGRVAAEADDFHTVEKRLRNRVN